MKTSVSMFCLLLSLAFLGVEWNEGVLRFHEHARSQPLRSPSYAEVTKPVFKRGEARAVCAFRISQPIGEVVGHPGGQSRHDEERGKSEGRLA